MQHWPASLKLEANWGYRDAHKYKSSAPHIAIFIHNFSSSSNTSSKVPSHVHYLPHMSKHVIIQLGLVFFLHVANTTQSPPFTEGSSLREVYFQLKYTTKTFTHAQPLTFKWLPSILSHPPHYIRKFRAQNEGITPGNNMAQFFSLWGFILRNVWSFKILYPSYSIWAFWKGLFVSNWPVLPFLSVFISLAPSCSLSLLQTHTQWCVHVHTSTHTHAHYIPI